MIRLCNIYIYCTVYVCIVWLYIIECAVKLFIGFSALWYCFYFYRIKLLILMEFIVLQTNKTPSIVHGCVYFFTVLIVLYPYHFIDFRRNKIKQNDGYRRIGLFRRQCLYPTPFDVEYTELEGCHFVP